jgi:hypothetical protein
LAITLPLPVIAAVYGPTVAGLFAFARSIASLPAGSYDVSVEAAGFSKKIQTGVRLQVAQTARVDIGLQVSPLLLQATVS